MSYSPKPEPLADNEVETSSQPAAIPSYVTMPCSANVIRESMPLLREIIEKRSYALGEKQAICSFKEGDFVTPLVFSWQQAPATGLPPAGPIVKDEAFEIRSEVDHIKASEYASVNDVSIPARGANDSIKEEVEEDAEDPPDASNPCVEANGDECVLPPPIGSAAIGGQEERSAGPAVSFGDSGEGAIFSSGMEPSQSLESFRRSESGPMLAPAAPLPVTGDVHEVLQQLLMSQARNRSLLEAKLNVCKVCGKAFSRPSNLRTHERIHTGDKPFSCHLCPKSFTQLANFKSHERIHKGERPFVCEACSKSFSRLSHLRAHERTHSGDKPYACHLCDKTFNQSTNLRRHELTHSGERPHVCALCDKSFTQTSSLRTHERSHSGDKPHACGVCDKSFTQPSSLRIHERSHSGEKPHACNVCDKTFTYRSSLRTHLRTHSRDPAHVCAVCDKNFTQLSSLRRHELLHSATDPP